MADKLEWMNKHFIAVRYTHISDICEKENYKIRPDLEGLFSGINSGESMTFKLGKAGKWKDACELMTYLAHRRIAVWWCYRCILSLMEEILLNPAGQRDIADIGLKMEPEVPDFAKVALPKPDPAALAQVDALVADAKAKAKQANALLDQNMLHYVEEAVEVAFKEFKRVHGIHPIDLLKQIGAKLTRPRHQIDPNSPIILESAKLKAQLAAAQKETVETIKSVLPPKLPAHQKKFSDHALAAVYRWVVAPNQENTQRCLDVGNECPDQPGGLLALSAFWSFGNLMPTGDQVIHTPPGLAANGLTQTLLLCALAPGGVRKVKERYAEYFRLGLEVLTGANNWEASLVDRKMPHEQLPDPDWTKASDKSAADWQAEAGIGELPEEEKETVIVRMIAEVNPKHVAASPAEGLSTAKENGKEAGDPKKPPPPYKRWKP